MANPPYNLDTSNPADGSLGNAFPGNERTFRDNANSYLNTEHDINTGYHKFQQLTTANKNALGSPPSGMVVFDTTLNQGQYNSGTSGAPKWVALVPFEYNGFNRQAGNYSVVAGDQGKVITNTGATGATTITLLASGSAGLVDGWSCSFLTVANQTITLAANTGNTFALSNGSIPTTFLVTSQWTLATVVYDATAAVYVLFVGTGASGITTVLTQNMNYYVNASTGNDNNAGTNAAPWLTLQHAWNWIQANVDFNGFVITVNCTGIFAAGLAANGVMVGNTQGAAGITFLGNTSNPAAVTVSDVNSFAASNGADLTVKGFQLTASGSVGGTGYCLYAANGSYLVFDSIYFNTANKSFIYASAGGAVNQVNAGSHKVLGNAISFIHADPFGQIVISSVTANWAAVTFSNPIFFSDQGNVQIESWTMTGSTGNAITGQQGHTQNCGIINTGGSANNTWPTPGATSFPPGSTIGTSASNGFFD